MGRDVGGLEAKGPRRKLWPASCAPRHPAPRRQAADVACLEGAGSCLWCWCLNRVPVRANLQCEPEASWESIQGPVCSHGERTGPRPQVTCSVTTLPEGRPVSNNTPADGYYYIQ